MFSNIRENMIGSFHLPFKIFNVSLIGRSERVHDSIVAFLITKSLPFVKAIYCREVRQFDKIVKIFLQAKILINQMRANAQQKNCLSLIADCLLS